MKTHPMVTPLETGYEVTLPWHRAAAYLGFRSRLGTTVLMLPAGIVLPPRLDLRHHSPTGFAWGYGGSGPAQLALAILSDATQCRETSVNLYQLFKREVIATIDADQWLIDRHDVRQWAIDHPFPSV